MSHYVHNLNPVLLNLGGLQIRWYGLMYVVGFVIAGFLFKKLVKSGFFKIKEEKIDSLITTLIVSMFLGARFAYVFIYNWDYYSQHLLELLAVWQGGLSFHGAVAGMCIGGWIFAVREKISWFEVMDALALAGAQGLFFGRMGNFINGELFGRATDSWVGIVFPEGGLMPRHPSQLYEAIFEGIILFLILWAMKRRVKFYGVISAMFVGGYGFFRFLIEFFREPDAQLGYYFGGVTMGQILCFLMMLIAVGMYLYAKKRNILINN